MAGAADNIMEISSFEHAKPFKLKKPDRRPATLGVLRLELALPAYVPLAPSNSKHVGSADETKERACCKLRLPFASR